MPTRHKTINDTNAIDILQPPKNRKVVISMVEAFNTGTADVKLTLQQVSPDGSITKTLDIIPIAQGQAHIVNDSKVYETYRGWKIQGLLDTAGVVELTITYDLK